MSRRTTRRRGKSPEIQITAAPGREGEPLHTRVYTQIRGHILAGSLAPGDRLPSARTLAADLRVSRNTVEAAFDQLVAEGFVSRRVGSGSVVASTLREAAPFGPHAATSSAASREAEAPKPSRRGRLIARLGLEEMEADPASTSATDIDMFPRKTWGRLMARMARRGGVALLASSAQEGLPELRTQIAEYVTLARGVRCESRQVVICNSTQQAIDLSARVLLDEGDEAVVEQPGYLSARYALRANGARLRYVPVDDDGLLPERLPEDERPRLLYLTPSHQFPTGGTLTLSRRLAVLSWAARTGAWILEDDYDSEFRHDGRPLAALQSLDSGGRVIYIGTFNKVLFPGLRLAYAIVPPALVTPFAAARRLSDGHSSPLAQATAAEFMTSGHFAAYVRHARQRYGEKRRTLVREIDRLWGPSVRLGPSSTGLHVVVHLPTGVDDVAIARASDGRGLGVTPLSRYYGGLRARPGLLLSYGAAELGSIAPAVAELAPFVKKHARR